MSSSTLTRTSGSAPCGCGGGSSGTALASPCSCGGAACGACETKGYSRPRFFAGQLLTEEDLQALSDYVLAKNRLHNRHFMGDGVVCGLQVTCNPCGGSKLIVQPGHALDCCGNDLVLECAVELDAVAMVRDLRRSLLGGQDCGDPCAERKPNGDPLDANERAMATRHYCLYLRYTEDASDPVAPYATDEPCGPAGCEFTRCREGVRFELRCRNEIGPPDGFLQRVRACLDDLTRSEAFTAALRKLGTAQATSGDFADARETLLDMLDNTPQLTDCSLRADVAAIPVPPAGTDLSAAIKKLLHGYLRLLRDCVCRALLPPCMPCDDTGVLLACIEMADCAVVDICNLERRFVLTGPNFRYWFPVNLIGDLLEKMCCADIRIEEEKPNPNADGRAQLLQRKRVKIDAGAPAAANAADADTKALLDMLETHLRESFGLTERDGTALSNIASNFAGIFSNGAFDDLLPARALRRRLDGTNVKETLSNELIDSAAFSEVTGELKHQHEVQLEAAREQLKADNAEAIARENRELRSHLEALTARVNALESPPASDTPDGTARKTRK